ncbi:uncharacterized protein TNCV_390051 [Trichonephila clavipes]|nr:uncharacterized protein TNCV_390051 [Trichonephila clavipes]
MEGIYTFHFQAFSRHPLDFAVHYSGRTTDVAARLNFGTAVSLIVQLPLELPWLLPLRPCSLAFSPPIPFGPTVGYARKSKSLFSGITQENVLQVLDTVTKAIEAYSVDTAKPKL